MTHLNAATQKFKAIPAERFKQKLGRTVAGVGLFVAGVYCKKHALLTDTYTTGFLVVGGLTASFEFVRAPITFAIAALRDFKAALLNGKPKPPGEDPAA